MPWSIFEVTNCYEAEKGSSFPEAPQAATAFTKNAFRQHAEVSHPCLEDEHKGNLKRRQECPKGDLEDWRGRQDIKPRDLMSLDPVIVSSSLVPDLSGPGAALNICTSYFSCFLPQQQQQMRLQELSSESVPVIWIRRFWSHRRLFHSSIVALWLWRKKKKSINKGFVVHSFGQLSLVIYI